LEIEVLTERWATQHPFRITGHVWTEISVVVVELRDGMHAGRGEACGVYYKGETPDKISAQIDTIASAIRRGIDRTRLLSLLPAGGARNAIDCALWEIEAQRSG
jgi:L-alanine-DL-glutamate epimerase-like enolase superfamily enzyme